MRSSQQKEEKEKEKESKPNKQKQEKQQKLDEEEEPENCKPCNFATWEWLQFAGRKYRLGKATMSARATATADILETGMASRKSTCCHS